MSDCVYVRFSDCFCKSEDTGREIERKADVVKYLRSNELGAMCAGWMRGQFTGELVRGYYDYCRSDGAYKWGESLAYYVDKYNLELLPEFLAHIYSRLDR